MARKKSLNSIQSVEEAYKAYGELGACKASILKYARVIDATESGRDMKPLISGMFEAIDRLKMIEAKDKNTQKVTPLLKILDAASNE